MELYMTAKLVLHLLSTKMGKFFSCLLSPYFLFLVPFCCLLDPGFSLAESSPFLVAGLVFCLFSELSILMVGSNKYQSKARDGSKE